MLAGLDLVEPASEDVERSLDRCLDHDLLAFEPPERIVFTWDISPHWQVEADRDKASEVEVRFIAESGTRTRVKLEHRHLDRHGEGWQGLAGGVGGEGGWPLYLQRYGAAVARA